MVLEKKDLNIVNQFKDKRVLVIGDVMLDEYIIGEAQRLSPEAPIPILHVQKKEVRLGGAANTANNISSLGGIPELVSVVGDDSQGKMLMNMLRKSNIKTSRVVSDHTRFTTVKTRVVSGYKNHPSQQIVRYDQEVKKELVKKVERDIILYLKDVAQRVNVCVVSDYAKGVMTPLIIQTIRELSKKGLCVIIDAKPERIPLYSGCQWFTPNLVELEKVTGISTDQENMITLAVGEFFVKTHAKHVLVTAGDKGMHLFNSKNMLQNHLHLPALTKEIVDVSGAGDTVVAALALALSIPCKEEECCNIANAAASIVVKKYGTSTASVQELVEVLKNVQDC